MRRTIFAILILLWVVSAETAGKQSPESPAEGGGAGGATVTILELGSDKSTPGTWVVVPMTLTAPSGVQVGAIKDEIAFPVKLLSFETAKPGAALESEGSEMNTLVKPDDTNPENLILEVTVTSKEGKAIPNGLVAKLVFKILEEAPAVHTVRLKNVVNALTADMPRKPLAPIKGEDGEIRISGGILSIFGCFFYMH